MNADTEVFTNPPIRRVVGHCSGYLQNNLNNLKPKKDLGLCPKPHSPEAAGRWQTNPPTPTASVVDSKASRVKCTASPPLTPFHLHENSETIRKRTEQETCQGFAKQPRSGLAFTGWRRPNAQWLGCSVSRGVACTLPRGERGLGQRPVVLTSPLGARSRGNVPKALI